MARTLVLSKQLSLGISRLLPNKSKNSRFVNRKINGLLLLQEL